MSSTRLRRALTTARFTRRRLLHTGVLGASLAFAGCVGRGFDGPLGSERQWDALALDAQLERVRAATRQYRDVNVAAGDGFAEATLSEECTERFYRRQGWETDRTLDPLRPNGLVYAADGDARRLVAVAYLLPIRTREPTRPPDLFNDEGARDEPLVAGYAEEHIWEAIPDETGVYDGLFWQLLVWVHESNPFGVFNSYNPNYPLALGDTRCAAHD